MKTCNVCNSSDVEFYLRRSSCKRCYSKSEYKRAKQYHKEYRVRNADKIALYQKNKTLTVRGIFNNLRDKQFSFAEFEEWFGITSHCCHYCGKTEEEFCAFKKQILESSNSRFKKAFKTKRMQQISRLTIDRKDNTQNYTIQNIVKCCWICNFVKGDFFSYDEMKNYIISFLYC